MPSAHSPRIFNSITTLNKRFGNWGETVRKTREPLQIVPLPTLLLVVFVVLFASARSEPWLPLLHNKVVPVTRSCTRAFGVNLHAFLILALTDGSASRSSRFTPGRHWIGRRPGGPRRWSGSDSLPRSHRGRAVTVPVVPARSNPSLLYGKSQSAVVFSLAV